MTIDDYTDYRKRMMLMHKSRVNGNERKHLVHYQRVKKILDAYKTRHASLEFRRDAINGQNKLNYQIEYDRIRNELKHSILPHKTREELIKREKDLLDLGVKAVDGIV